MVSKITNNIEVQVTTQYQVVYSNPLERHFVFAYFITLINHGEDTVQLLRRRWEIYDDGVFVREVEGPGVVGEQPVLKAGAVYSYNSGTNFENTSGSMRGEYLFWNIDTGEQFYVDIPDFIMEVPEMFL